MIITEIQNLFKKMLSDSTESISAFNEYSEKRWQTNWPQVETDNSFLHSLAMLPTIDHCSPEIMSLAATIYV